MRKPSSQPGLVEAVNRDKYELQRGKLRRVRNLGLYRVLDQLGRAADLTYPSLEEVEKTCFNFARNCSGVNGLSR
jgi:hypothetical protein